MSAFKSATGQIGVGVGDSPFKVKNNVIQPKNKYHSLDFMVNGMFQADEIQVSSDMLLKSNIEDIDKDMIKKLDEIAPKQYYFKKDVENKRPHYGFIAQEFEKIFPNLVIMRSNNTKAVNYLEMIPLLLLKIQMMQKEIDELKK